MNGLGINNIFIYLPFLLINFLPVSFSIVILAYMAITLINYYLYKKHAL